MTPRSNTNRYPPYQKVQFLQQDLSRQPFTWTGFLKRNLFFRRNPDKPKTLLIFTDLGFQTHNSPNLPIYIFLWRVKSTALWLREWYHDMLLIMDFDTLVGILIVPKGQNDITLDISRCSKLYFSTSNGLTSSIKVLSGSFLSVEGSSKWNSLIFAEAKNFMIRQKRRKALVQ